MPNSTRMGRRGDTRETPETTSMELSVNLTTCGWTRGTPPQQTGQHREGLQGMPKLPNECPAYKLPKLLTEDQLRAWFEQNAEMNSMAKSASLSLE